MQGPPPRMQGDAGQHQLRRFGDLTRQSHGRSIARPSAALAGGVGVRRAHRTEFVTQV